MARKSLRTVLMQAAAFGVIADGAIETIGSFAIRGSKCDHSGVSRRHTAGDFGINRRQVENNVVGVGSAVAELHLNGTARANADYAGMECVVHDVDFDDPLRGDRFLNRALWPAISLSGSECGTEGQ